jgi:hypothetical protein
VQKLERKRSHSEMAGKIGRGIPSDDGKDDDFEDGEDVGDGSESEFIIYF